MVHNQESQHCRAHGNHDIIIMYIWFGPVFDCVHVCVRGKYPEQSHPLGQFAAVRTHMKQKLVSPVTYAGIEISYVPL